MRPRILDPALPGLDVALDATRMSSPLGQLLAEEHGGEPGSWRVVGVELIKHKPGRRCALAYTADGPVGRRQLFAKAFRNDRGATILVNMHQFHAALARTAIRVPRPLGYVPELKLLVTEYVDGRALATALYDGRSEEPARRMAAAAAEFHACGVTCARRWSPQKELRATREWIAGLSGRVPAEVPRSRELLDMLERTATLLPRELALPVHRDFYPEQLADAGGATAVLDLDDTRAGDPALDVGNFMAHLTLRAFQFPETAAGCALARRAFAAEYGQRCGREPDAASFSRRLVFYEASSLLRLSGVYSARERWAAVIPSRLLDACEALTKEGVR